MCLQFSMREIANTGFDDFVSSYFSSFSSLVNPLSPYWNQLKSYFSLNVSRFTGGVHGHQVIVTLLLQINMVDRGDLRGRHWTMPFAANSTCGNVFSVQYSHGWTNSSVLPRFLYFVASWPRQCVTNQCCISLNLHRRPTQSRWTIFLAGCVGALVSRSTSHA